MMIYTDLFISSRGEQTGGGKMKLEKLRDVKQETEREREMKGDFEENNKTVHCRFCVL